MHSYKVDASVNDCAIVLGRFFTHRFVNRVVTILSGSLLWASLIGFVFAAMQMSWAQTEKVLYSFCALQNCADGANPAANLVSDETGDLYGTTAIGGIVGGLCESSGCGTVFERTASGKVKILHRFSGSPDGENPISGLIRDSEGNLYGTTALGGKSGRACGTYGCGTVFKLVKSGDTYTEKVVFAFAGGADGLLPSSGLVRDADGNLYGTTPQGGGSGCTSGSGCGTVYKLTSVGDEEVIYRFTGGVDGATPSASLILDEQGYLYGTTAYGGNFGGPCTASGCGTVFEVEPSTKREVVLYRFNGADGQIPMSPLIRDANGSLYGTTLTGGDVKNLSCDIQENGCGVVFELTRSGALVVRHSFTGYPADGQNPLAGLIRDEQGNLYGTTAWGGRSDVGTAFKVRPGGLETVLHSFIAGSDGSNPNGSLVLDSKGNLYGTALYGGAFGEGVLFEVIP
jgi:uncharacterized repeat protein (TIGR03803 family)